MDLSAIVRCPRCKGPLDASPDHYDCRACALRYPVTDGIPDFLLDDAEKLAPHEHPRD